MLKLECVTKRFGPVKALDGVSLELQQGDVNVVCGPSGAGKTTLLRVVVGLDEPDEGRVFIGPCDVARAGRAARDARRQVGTVFQCFNLFSHLTAVDNVALAPIRVLGRSRAEARAQARRLLADFDLAAHADKYPRQLSGGQQQRVAIARCLAMDPKLVLFDEPTSALDPERKYQVVETLSSLRARGITMLVITHELDLAEAIAQRVFFMDAGRIVEDGDPARIFGAPVESRTLAFVERHRRLRRTAAQAREERAARGAPLPWPTQHAG